MRKFLWILPLFLFVEIIQAQILEQPCEIQARMQTSICFDPPGCINFEPVDFTGGTLPYQYLWDNGSTNASIGYSGPGIPDEICHTVTVTDARGCRVVLSTDRTSKQVMADTILYEDQPVTYDLSQNDSTGLEEFLLVQAPSHGQLTISEGGVATFTPDATWCGVDYFRYAARKECGVTPVVTCLLDRTNCSSVLTTAIDCNAECTGTAFFYGGGDLPQPLSYQWSNGELTDTVRSLCAGQHSLTVTDGVGQAHSFDFSISSTTIDVSIEGPSGVCSSGFLELAAEIDLDSDSVTQITYAWSGPGFSQDRSGPNATFFNIRNQSTDPVDYRLVATTQSGCIDSAIHTVSIHPRPSIDWLPNHQSAFGPVRLELEAEFEGGTPPFQFLWTGPGGIYSDRPTLIWPNVTSNNNGQFRFRVSDGNGCTATRSRSYIFRDSINFRIVLYEPNHTLCKGSDLYTQFGYTASVFSGIDSIRLTGPNGYYANDLLATSPSIFLENLQPEDAGTYYIEAFLGSYVLTDSMEVTISPNEASVLNTELTPLVSCASPTGGSVAIEIDGPAPFRSFISGTGGAFVDAEESPVIHQDLSQYYGGRSVHIRTGHADLCYVHTRIPTYTGPVTTDFEITTADCENQNGVVSLEISPPAEQVRWNIDGRSYTDTTFMAENVPAGWHSVRIEGAAECTRFTVPFYMPAVVDFGIQMNTQPDCFNTSGELEVLVQEPSDGAFEVTWSNGTAGTVNSNLSTGWYSVTVTDDSGCERHKNFFLPATEPCLSTISGQVYVNTDCVCEADSNYLTFANIKVCATSETYTQCTFTNHAGEYTLPLPETGVYEISSVAYSPYFSENCLPDPVEISAIGEHVIAQDLFYCGEAVYDASISIYCNTPRPGFEQRSSIRLRNTGVLAFDTATVSALISPLIDVNYISPQPISFNQNTNEIIWASTQSLSRLGYVDFIVKGTVIGNLGEEITNSVSVVLDTTEVLYTNNASECTKIIVGSFDPNDKQVSPEGIGEGGGIRPLDSLLHYTIRFQNTGTDTAFTVIVRDTLDQEVFDLSSIKPISNSHPVRIDIEEGNILVFSFFDILLPDSTTSLVGSNGYVEFEIKIAPGLSTDIPIENSAAIYFDFNDPIITNTTRNTIVTSTQNQSKPPINFEVFPNPSGAEASLRFEFEKYVEDLTVEIFDIQGRFIQGQQWTNGFPSGRHTLPLSSFEVANGTYLLKLSTEHGVGVRKWIRL